MTDNIFSLYEPSAQIWSSIEMVNNAINRARFPDWCRVRLKFMAPPDECIGARTRIHHAQRGGLLVCHGSSN